MKANDSLSNGTTWVAPGAGSTVADIGAALIRAWNSYDPLQADAWEAARNTIRSLPSDLVTRLHVGAGPYDLKDLERIAALKNFPEDSRAGYARDLTV